MNRINGQNVSLDASSLINLFLVTVRANVTAVSAVGTHIVGAPLDAIGAAILITDDCKSGNAPILLDGRVQQGKLSQANRVNGILSRAEVLGTAAMTPIETISIANVVISATQTVKRFESVAHDFGSGKQGAVDGSRLAILL
jgi:hypothetical protein